MRARGAWGARGLGWLALTLAVWAAGGRTGLQLNLTESLPVGLYRAAHGAPTRGGLVLVCLTPRIAAFARARGYVPRGGRCPGGVVPIGKVVLAVAGDTVTVTPTGLLLNGAPVPNSQPLTRDRRGRPLPHLAGGRYAVGPGELWALSPYSRYSFDSRYFGPITLGQVRARLSRLWTAGADP